MDCLNSDPQYSYMRIFRHGAHTKDHEKDLISSTHEITQWKRQSVGLEFATSLQLSPDEAYDVSFSDQLFLVGRDLQHHIQPWEGMTLASFPTS